MSFFTKVLSSVGIGSAKVDTILHSEVFVPGGEVEGVVQIKGGKLAQQIDAIFLSVISTYQEEFEYESEGETEEGEKTLDVVLQKIQLTDAFTIGADEETEIPLSFQLPYDAPLTLGKTQVWIKTALDIDNAIDPSDKDYIKVAPDSRVEALFEAAHHLGFELHEAECTAASLGRRLPFIQEFEFITQDGPFHGKLDELEMVLDVEESVVNVALEIDRKARGISGFLSEVLGSDESLVRFSFNDEGVEELTDILGGIIDQYS